MIEDSSFRNNTASQDGAGLYHRGGYGSLDLTRSSFEENIAMGDGGGIWGQNTIYSSLNLTDSTFLGNEAANGGGLFAGVSDGSPFEGLTFIGNSATVHGGGLYSIGREGRYGPVRLTVDSSHFENNSAAQGGGGIFHTDFSSFDRGILELSDCTIVENTSPQNGGGIYNDSSLIIAVNSSLAGNATDEDGGGLMNTGEFLGFNLTFEDNLADTDGGGLFNDGGRLALTNTTFSGNQANDDGGAIYNEGPFTLAQSTLSGNSADDDGAGILNRSSLTLFNSLLAANFSDNDDEDDLDNKGDGTTFHLGVNLFGTTGLGGANDLVETDPAQIFASLSDFSSPDETTFSAGTLADNGGSILTVAILEGGQAHNTGSSDAPPIPSLQELLYRAGTLGAELSPFDARGVAHANNGGVDIGAFEIAQADPFTADSDGDGSPYALEIALGTNPNAADSSHPNNLQVLEQSSAGNPTLSFGHDLGNAPANTLLSLFRSYTLEGDFEEILQFDGTTIDTGPAGIVGSIDSSGTILTIIDGDNNEPKAFYRLQVSVIE